MKTFSTFVLIIFVLGACTNRHRNDHSQQSKQDRTEQNQDAHGEHNRAQDEAAIKYTCSMHPQVVRDNPGQCPICGMDLVEIRKTDGASDDLMLTSNQIKLANITIQRVTKKPVGQTVAINAQLKVDEQKSEVISSRAAGRIEKLLIKETGQSTRQGQPLYILYSEELLTLQQEYLLAKQQYEAIKEKRYKSFLDAAERKLLLYGLAKSQITQLSQNSLQPRITFLSPTSGIVTELNAAEGQYVSEGTSLFKIEDINSLWVEAELYPNETSVVKVGDKINVRVSGIEANTIETRVTFLSPEFRNNTQITIMRASIKNPDNIFRPGQFAQVYLTHSSREAIAVPSDAVIRDGEGSHVYLQSGHNTFRPQMVKTGIETFDQVEITEGLQEGDTVAVTGAYLLYSEIILKKGTDPMAGHSH